MPDNCIYLDQMPARQEALAAILTDVTPENPIFAQEIFGPVMMVFSWSDEEEILRLANGIDFGLGSSVYTENLAAAQRIALALESGAVSVNQFTAASPAIPFGGIKQSGFGCEMGREGIVEFMNQKLINSVDMDVKAFTL
ncbi:MAG: aldehyde dehydrogenase family protein [Atopobiaceae bacterium]|jgi:succinate-semialdehyde dehydrogenase/glutarate-semialdehyde dehydrogenase|nr:aldehyde dehydrogenase family protein [Atopobiaceae bacterium]MCI2050936.1 aldehyde dehydrogenase family protein [Atopobiaceae bacterium]